MENAVRASRHSLVAEHTSGNEHTDRRLLFFHYPNLTARSVGAEKNVGVGFDKECILHIACGVLGREVESGKIVIIVFNFLTFGNGKSKASKNFDNLVLNHCDWVVRTEGDIRTGQRCVEVGRLRRILLRAFLSLLNFLFY